MTLKKRLTRSRMLAYISVAAAVLVGGVFATRAALAPARAVTVSPVTTEITVNPSVGITFGPAPTAAAGPALSATQAWAQYAQVNRWSTTVPTNDTVQLGLVTVPVGPASAPGTENLVTVNNIAYMAYNQLAYAYSSPTSCPQGAQGADSLGDPNPPTATPTPAGSCILWEFVDANSGKQIVSTWQVIG